LTIDDDVTGRSALYELAQMAGCAHALSPKRVGREAEEEESRIKTVVS
jgi:hypothetical protein